MNVEAIKSNNIYQPVQKKEKTKKVKTAALIGSTLGVGLTSAAILLASSKKPDFKFSKFHYKDPQLVLVGAGSVLGGLIGGIATDKKENYKHKYREAMHQFFGNIISPITVLAINTKILDATKVLAKAKPAVKNVVQGIVTVGSLIIGMEAGNRIVGKINNKLFGEKVEHKVKLEDYSVHVDDICMTVSHIAEDSKISTVASHLLPITFLLSGYKAGSAQEKPKQN